MQNSELDKDQRDRKDAMDLAIRVLEASPGTLPHLATGQLLAEYAADFADGLKQYVLKGSATAKS